MTRLHHQLRPHILWHCLFGLLASACLLSADQARPKKLKIVFMMGQSNMQGFSTPQTAWYLTQDMYVPPAESATARGKYYDDSFYWQGLDFGEGDSPGFAEKSEALLEERKASRKLWRERIFGNFSRAAREANKKDEWNYKEWGDPPHVRKIGNQPFLDIKAEEEGIYRRMVEHIESPENKCHPKVVIAGLGKRDELIADDIKRVREIFVKGTKPEDFDKLEVAIREFGRVDHENREAYAKLVEKYVHLPVAKRTCISAYGGVSGAETEHEFDFVTHGILSVGYGKHAQAFGPEYAFGISYEQLVDGPVLLIKCSWGGTSIHSDWRPPSLANAETPNEKTHREANNQEPQTGTGGCWQRAMAHVQKVLADPGKYHPDYDPEAGVELAGLIWFQGWNDLGNPAYGEQLVHFIQDFRKEVKAPELPVICGLVGHAAWKSQTFSNNVNRGMLYAARHDELRGTVDVVNTVKYYPVELGLKKSVETAFGKESGEYKKADEIMKRSCSNSGLHYFGSAKFLCLTGNTMARKLANLHQGNEPSIHAEAEEILKAN